MLNPLNLVKKIFKSHNQSELDRIRKIVNKINSLENETAKLENKDFPLKTEELKKELENGKNLDSILPKAFALVTSPFFTVPTLLLYFFAIFLNIR